MSPPKVTVTGTGLVVWLHRQMCSEAAPDELVVAVHVWAEAPEPRVKVTVCPDDGAPCPSRW